MHRCCSRKSGSFIEEEIAYQKFAKKRSLPAMKRKENVSG